MDRRRGARIFPGIHGGGAMRHFPGSTLRELSRSGRAAIPDPLGTQGRGSRLLLRGTGLVLELRQFVAGPPPFRGLSGGAGETGK